MVTILYRPQSEHERIVLDFQRELGRSQVSTTLVNIDSREGTSTAQLYDIVKYPAVIITEADGRVLNSWSGDLPQLAEVVAQAHS